MTTERIDVTVPGVREKFAGWVAQRGGVAVWENANLSTPDAGEQFTPAVTDGAPTPQPHWSVKPIPEIVTDLARFRFVKSFREVGRRKIAVRVSGNGLMLKLTDASTRKVNNFQDSYKEKHGVRPFYRFEDDEAVFEVAEWED